VIRGVSYLPRSDRNPARVDITVLGVNTEPCHNVDTELLRTAMLPLVEWITAGNKKHSNAARALTLALHLGVEVDGVRSYADIARTTDSSRSSVQFSAKQLEDRWRLRWRGARTDDTRRRNACAAFKRHDAATDSNG
jgi:hypothetical protein